MAPPNTLKLCQAAGPPSSRCLRIQAVGSQAGAGDSFAADLISGLSARLAAEAGWSSSKSWISDAPQVALFRLEPALGESS
jgi:hypothetical protein